MLYIFDGPHRLANLRTVFSPNIRKGIHLKKNSLKINFIVFY